jgi:hypothetical protein
MRPLLNVNLLALAGVAFSVGNIVAQSNGDETIVNITPRSRNPLGKAETGPRANGCGSHTGH